MVLDSEDDDEASELVGDSEVVLDSEVDVEVSELEGDSEVLVDSELVEDDEGRIWMRARVPDTGARS